MARVRLRESVTYLLGVFVFSAWMHTRTCLAVTLQGEKFTIPHGPDTRSTKATMLYKLTRSRFHCGAECSELYACGGYNYRKLLSGHVECELTQGESLLAEVQSSAGWTYYQRVAQDDAVVSRNCQDRQARGYTTSGQYQINLTPAGPAPTLTMVYCDMDTAGGGWLVMLRRQDGSVDFNTTWADYKGGFGTLAGEFWIGLDTMHELSTAGLTYQLRVDMTLFDGTTSAYAQYDNFTVTDEADNYKLYVGTYSGTAGDSLSTQNGIPFSTPDNRNDVASYDCAVTYASGYWYKSCGPSRLTGPYGQNLSDPVIDGREYFQGILWYHWVGLNTHPQYADMKIKPL